MKKIKKFFKKHYKRIITVFCVLISLFVFSFSAFGVEFVDVPYSSQFDYLQAQLMSNSSHSSITVRGYNPLFVFKGYEDFNINVRNSADFQFHETEKINFTFQNIRPQLNPNYDGFEFMEYSSGALLIEFDFLFAGKSLDYVEVLGFKVNRGAKNITYNSGSFDGQKIPYFDPTIFYNVDYNYVSITRTNKNYKYSNGNTYPSYNYHIKAVVPIQYTGPITSIQLTLGFKGNKATSYTQFQIRNYNGFTYYSSLDDVPFSFGTTPTPTPDDDEIFDDYENSENNLNDIVGDYHDKLDDFMSPGDEVTEQGLKPIMGLGKVFDYLVESNSKLYTLVYFSMAIGIFPFVVNIINTTIGKRSK